jgi:hypothetical protein
MMYSTDTILWIPGWSTVQVLYSIGTSTCNFFSSSVVLLVPVPVQYVPGLACLFLYLYCSRSIYFFVIINDKRHYYFLNMVVAVVRNSASTHVVRTLYYECYASNVLYICCCFARFFFLTASSNKYRTVQ